MGGGASSLNTLSVKKPPQNSSSSTSRQTTPTQQRSNRVNTNRNSNSFFPSPLPTNSNTNSSSFLAGASSSSFASQTGNTDSASAASASVPNSNLAMPCASCSQQFTILNRKTKCDKCGLMFCEGCLVPIESTGDTFSISSLMCVSCFVFLGPVILRSQLMRLKVRDLMRQLHVKGVNNTRGCLTKGELIDLLANVSSVTLLDDATSFDQNISSPSSNSGTVNTDMPSGSNSGNNNNNSAFSSNFPNGASNANETNSQTNAQSTTSQVKERKQLVAIENEDDIEKLTVKELKEILVNNFVHIKGLCEKEDLVQKAKMLWRQEIGQRKAAAAKASKTIEEYEVPEEETCRICMDQPINCVLLECGHMVACVLCGKQLAECPVCRQYVVRAVHTFRT